MRVQALGWEHPLVEGMATHCRILAWRSLWTEEPDGLQSTRSHRVGHDQACMGGVLEREKREYHVENPLYCSQYQGRKN